MISHDFLTDARTTCQGRTGLPGCGEPIRWVKLAGKPHPINPAPDAERGNLAVVECETGYSGKPNPAVVVLLSRAAKGEHDGALYLSHFATCPLADKFRNRNGAQPSFGPK